MSGRIMKKFERGQIWLVNFEPSFGHEYQKVRPALIIQNEKYIDSGNLLTVIPISSQIANPEELDILIKVSEQNRLMKDSLLKMRHISSFDRRRFIKLVGVAGKETMDKVDRCLQLFIFGNQYSQMLNIKQQEDSSKAEVKSLNKRDKEAIAQEEEKLPNDRKH
jgi:mRNA interferase MazF